MTRKLGFLLIAVMLLLAACSSANNNNNNNNNNDTPNNTDNGKAPVEETVTLTMQDYMQGGNSEAIDAMVAAFMEEYPHIVIKRENVPFSESTSKLMMGTVSQTLPDIALVDGADHPALAAAGVFMDISDYVEEWGEIDQYYDGPVSSTLLDGKHYGIPLSNNLLALFYNVDMFEEAGLEPPTTWEELKSHAAALSKDNVYGFGAAGINTEEGTFQFLPFVWQGGGDVTDLDSQGTIDALNLWKDMIDQGHMSQEIITMTQQDVMIQFASGRFAMMVNGPWQFPNLNEQADFEWATVPLPAGENQGTILGGMNYGISAISENPDAAWEFIKFTQRAENLKQVNIAIGNVPPRKDVIQDDHWQLNEKVKPFADSMPFAKARAYGPDYPSMSVAIQVMMQKVFIGQSTAEDAVKEAAARVEEFLD